VKKLEMRNGHSGVTGRVLCLTRGSVRGTGMTGLWLESVTRRAGNTVPGSGQCDGATRRQCSED